MLNMHGSQGETGRDFRDLTDRKKFKFLTVSDNESVDNFLMTFFRLLLAVDMQARLEHWFSDTKIQQSETRKQTSEKESSYNKVRLNS